MTYGLIDCWVVPEEPFHRRVGWVGTATAFGVIIIPFDNSSKESLLKDDSKVARTYPCDGMQDSRMSMRSEQKFSGLIN